MDFRISVPLFVLSLGCASQAPVDTAPIEPPKSPSQENYAATERKAATTPAPEPKQASPIIPASEIDIHPGVSWFDHRSKVLRISSESAKARDAGMHEGPPDDFWDEAVAVETWGLWQALCHECHGGTRDKAKVAGWRPPPAGYGQHVATFFNKEKKASDVFLTIYWGARAHKGDVNRPNWGASGKLSLEQIWGLVWFLESAAKIR